MNDTQANQPVTASLVASNRRLTFLPTYFGPRLMMRRESLVYAWLRRLSEDYNGGFWNYYELSNGGFYMAPKINGSLRLQNEGNYADQTVSADAAGIVVTLYALSYLVEQTCGADEDTAMVFSVLSDSLRQFAAEHTEASAIGALID